MRLVGGIVKIFGECCLIRLLGVFSVVYCVCCCVGFSIGICFCVFLGLFW